MVEYTIDHLSASQINLYLQCGLKYKFQYVDLIPRPFKSSGLVFGSVVHSTIDWFHKQKMIGKRPSLEMLYKILRADWFCQKLDSEIRYKEGEEEGKLILTAREMLNLYYQSPLDGVMDAEYPFRVPLVNLRTEETLGVALEGFIDLIGEGEVLTEFKTTNKTIDPQSADDLLQLTIYGYAYRLVFRKNPKGFRLVNFVKVKTPKMAVLDTGREEKDYERFFYLAKEVLKGIKSGVFFPRQSFICKDCEYENLCKAWQGNERS
ncbi:MAG: PD-(D/E)XK nuclease family protein [Deltaproteobacteria bacterium]|nr:PD-(D/E)XK nuclease family protein [Deltaproteobacteria bacterium]